MQKKFKNPVRYWQISRDNRYYPRPLSDGFMEKIGVDKNVFVEDTIGSPPLIFIVVCLWAFRNLIT